MSIPLQIREIDFDDCLASSLEWARRNRYFIYIQGVPTGGIAIFNTYRTCPAKTCGRARTNLGRAAGRDLVITLNCVVGAGAVGVVLPGVARRRGGLCNARRRDPTPHPDDPSGIGCTVQVQGIWYTVYGARYKVSGQASPGRSRCNARRCSLPRVTGGG